MPPPQHHVPTRPASAPTKPVPTATDNNSSRVASFRRPSQFRGANRPTGDETISQQMTQSRPFSLTDSERDAVLSVWSDMVAKYYRSTVQSAEELRHLFERLHVQMLPGVEEFALKYFTRHESQLDYDHFEQLVLLCKLKHQSLLEENPLLMDDLLDAFVALGGHWDTKGSLDNDKMRSTIKQYDLKIDFDRFLMLVDTDGNAEVDFDEFRKLVEEDPFSNDDHSHEDHQGTRGSEADTEGSTIVMIPRRGGGGPLSPLDVSAFASLRAGGGGGGERRGSWDETDGLSQLAVQPSGGFSFQRVVHQAAGSHATSPLESMKEPKMATAGPRSGGGGTLGATLTSPLRSNSVAVSVDHTAKLAERVAAVATHPASSAQSTNTFVAKQVPVNVMYRLLSQAVSNARDLSSFRERCSAIVKSTNRGLPSATNGNGGGADDDDDDGDFAKVAHSASMVINAKAMAAAAAAHARQSAFLDRMCTELKHKEALVSEKRAQLQQQRQEEEKQRKIRKRRQAAVDKVKAQEQEVIANFAFGGEGGAFDPAPPSRVSSMLKHGSHRRSISSSRGQPVNTSVTHLRDLSAPRATDILYSGGGSSARRRSTAHTHDLSAIAEGIDDPDEDDGINSVYSTSSSQRSDDDKRQPPNILHLLMSGKTTPTQAMSNTYREESMEGHENSPYQEHMSSGVGGPSDPSVAASAGGQGSPIFSGITAAADRRKSIAGGSTKVAAKLKMRERLFLSSFPTVRLSGNTNQMRCDKIRSNPEEDEAAKARARVPQVPLSKLTPRMRAQVSAMSIGEKKDMCKVDENGRERNELDAKLYECYFGRF